MVSSIVPVTILSRKVWYTLHGIVKVIVVLGYSRMFAAFSRLPRHFVKKAYFVHLMKMAG